MIYQKNKHENGDIKIRIPISKEERQKTIIVEVEVMESEPAEEMKPVMTETDSEPRGIQYSAPMVYRKE